MKRGAPLSQRGARARSEATKYSKAKAALRARHPECQLGPAISGSDPSHRCTGRYQGPHHLRKTGQGGSAVLEANMLSACNRCNDWVEDHPALALELGLVVVDGDSRWEQLGRRAERLS